TGFFDRHPAGRHGRQHHAVTHRRRYSGERMNRSAHNEGEPGAPVSALPDAQSQAPAPVARATWRDYLILTKPKVISLLLVTTVGAMFIAQGGFPGWIALIGILLGGFMSAGAAGVYNMIYDADIDVRMKRTAKRPTVTHVVTTRNALIFAIALTILSFVVIAVSTNVTAPLLSLARPGGATDGDV